MLIAATAILALTPSLRCRSSKHYVAFTASNPVIWKRRKGGRIGIFIKSGWKFSGGFFHTAVVHRQMCCYLILCHCNKKYRTGPRCNCCRCALRLVSDWPADSCLFFSKLQSLGITLLLPLSPNCVQISLQCSADFSAPCP